MGHMKELLTTIYGGGDEAVAAVERIGKDWREQLEQAASEIERLRAERRWIPVSERLPEEGQPVLGCWRLSRWADEMPSMVTSMWYKAGGFFDDNENRHRTPSHWMPAPEPPEVK